MKAVILAGGMGTRISEETQVRPKPMVEIGGRPIIWHILKIYQAGGIDDFVVCLGYKGYAIKEYFANYRLHMSNITFDMKNNTTVVHEVQAEPWKVTLVDTGETTMTGGRLKRVKNYIGGEPFCLTYGDGVADIDVKALVAFHKAHGRLATVTAVQPTGRYGTLDLEGDQVREFVEKPRGDGGWINGGFFVFSPGMLDFIAGDGASLESDVMTNLTQAGQLMAYKHPGYWHAMDTLRDRNLLESQWNTGRAPWKIW